MRSVLALILLAASCGAQQAPEQAPPPEHRLKTRTEVTAPETPPAKETAGKLWIVPAGTKLPIQLRQPVSTKGAKAGDAIYAQTSFPIVVNGNIVVPAGTWAQGVVDNVKRAGRLKRTAELQFHLTTLIYPNGYTLDIAAAVDQVPGDASTHMKEPGTVTHDSEKGKDLERVGDAAAKGAQIGAIAGTAASPSLRGFGVGGLSGIAAGTLIALLARGSDIRFETGTAIEIALERAMAIDPERVRAPAGP